MTDEPRRLDSTSSVTTIVVNGSPFELAPPATVASLLEARQPRPPFAVELNKRLVQRNTYATTPLAEGDALEIVTLVGGG